MKRIIALCLICLLLAVGMLSSCGSEESKDYSEYFTVGSPTLNEGDEQYMVTLSFTVTNYGKNDDCEFVCSIDGKINNFTLDPAEVASGIVMVAVPKDENTHDVETVFTVIKSGETVWQKTDTYTIDIEAIKAGAEENADIKAADIDWETELEYDPELDPTQIFASGLYDVKLNVNNESDQRIYCTVTGFCINNVELPADMLVASSEKEIAAHTTDEVHVRLGSEITSTTGQTEAKKFSMQIEIKDYDGNVLYTGSKNIEF